MALTVATHPCLPQCVGKNNGVISTSDRARSVDSPSGMPYAGNSPSKPVCPGIVRWEFFRCHDAAHVVFGCGTGLDDEAVVKIWSFFGTTRGPAPGARVPPPRRISCSWSRCRRRWRAARRCCASTRSPLAEFHDRPRLDASALLRIRPSAPPAEGLWETLWTGFYPRIHDRGLDPREWLADYFRTCVERDLRELMQLTDLRSFETFVRLAAARTGQELNVVGLADDAGIARTTASRWLSALEIGYLATRLPPHHANYRKRLRKRPRLHFLDTGLACYLLDIRDPDTLARHPLRGAIFESFVVSELIKSFAAIREDARLFSWRDSTGHEIDILLESSAGGEPGVIPIEVKSGETVASDAMDTLTWWTGIPDNPNRGGVLVAHVHASSWSCAHGTSFASERLWPSSPP